MTSLERLTALKEELTADPLGRGYAALDDRAAAERLNAPDRTVPASRLISERGVLTDYAPGPVAADALLGKLEAVANSASPLAGVVRRAMRFLQTPEGLDIGHPVTHQLIDQLVAAAALTAEEGAALKALGLRTVSRAQELGLGAVTTHDVTMARSM